MNDILNNFTALVRKGVDEYRMIDDGDAVAVGLSGGKDSLLLLCALKHLQRFYPKRFSLQAITVELGFPGMDFAPVAELCRRLNVPYTRIRTDIREVVFDVRQEPNPCALCAKMRRGALNTAMKELGCNKLALGHHYDDAVETFLMSLLLEGRISCFKPVTYMSRMDVWQNKGSKRYEIKRLIAELRKDYPDLRSKVFGAMQRHPLEGWTPAPLERRQESYGCRK